MLIKKFLYNDLFQLCSPRYFENLTRVFTDVHAGVIKTMLVLFVQYCRVNLLPGINLISEACLGLPEALKGTDACKQQHSAVSRSVLSRFQSHPESFSQTSNVIFPNTDQGTSPKRLNSKWQTDIEYKQGRNRSPHPRKGFVKISAKYFMKAQKTKMLGKDIEECYMSC